MILSYLSIIWIIGALFWIAYAMLKNIKATYPRALRIAFWPFVIAWAVIKILFKQETSK